MTVWHEDDNFWDSMASRLFGKEQWEKAPQEIECIISQLEIKPNSHILDLCCGPGRHALELARRGFKITAVDRTKKYLKTARQKAKEEGLEIEFVQEDMRNYINPNTFDLVINLFSSFGYFEDEADDLKVLKNIYSSLKDEGKLLMDMMGRKIAQRIFQERDWFEQEGVFYLEERKPDQEWKWLKNKWIMIKDGEIKEFRLSVHVYSKDELENILKKAGFKKITFFGGPTGKPYDLEAERLIALAVK